MKKIMLVAVALAVIFCFAACNKKGDVYEPPMTEVISFEDGVTAIFEVITEENGGVATDAEGETKYVHHRCQCQHLHNHGSRQLYLHCYRCRRQYDSEPTFYNSKQCS